MMRNYHKLCRTALLTSLIGLAASCAKEATFSDTRKVRHEAAATDPESIDQLPQVTELDKEFVIKSKDEEKLSVDFESQIYQKEFKLSEDAADKAKEYAQNDRTPVTKMFEQGTAGKAYTDTFEQAAVTGIVDILIIVDNSGSMAEEQQNLSTKLDPILSYLTNTDWQIGVVTTDAGSNCMRAVIKKGEANIDTRFQQAIQAGTNGASNERGVYQAMKGLSCTTPSWVRSNSTLAVLIISDEDNCSKGCSSNSGELPANLLKRISDPAPAGLGRTIGTQARVYGLIWHPGETCSTGENVGTQYAQAISLSSGTYGSICSADYTSTLQTMSANIASILKSQFSLTYEPDPGSLKVEVKPLGAADYSVVSNYTQMGTTVTFSEAPPVGSSIRMSYVVGKKGEIKSQFALDEKPAGGTLQVLLNGAAVGSGAYSVGSDNVLTFATVPPEGAQIKVMFRKDMPLLKDFNVEAGLDGAYVVVKVNAVETNDYTYSAATGVVSFNNPPADASAIRIDYKVFSQILRYDIGAVSQLLKAYDKLNSEMVNVTLDGEEVVFDKDTFVKGKVIVVEFKQNDSDLHSISFSYAPILDTVQITESSDCKIGDGITIEADKISIDCSLESLTKFDIQYEYEIESSSVFQFPGVSNPEMGKWSVSVNGKSIKDFLREGATITVISELAHGDVVRISYRQVTVAD
ncbi:MAG: hypothetical protein AB7T49_12335 [Oligoflexales bacterium]